MKITTKASLTKPMLLKTIAIVDVMNAEARIPFSILLCERIKKITANIVSVMTVQKTLPVTVFIHVIIPVNVFMPV
jgi:hypothetical protein